MATTARTAPHYGDEMSVTLRAIEGRLAVARLDASAPVPEWAAGPLVSVTRTPTELSIVCAERLVPEGVRAEVGRRALVVEGVRDQTVTWVLASLIVPLAEAEIDTFTVSTYDTDVVLVEDDRLAEACAILEEAGHRVEVQL